MLTITLFAAILQITAGVDSASSVGYEMSFKTPDLVIQDITVVDVERGKELEHQTVTVSGETIEDIFPAGTRNVKGKSAMDGAGKYLIPGLWDMHYHTGVTDDRPECQRHVWPLLLASGVTGIRYMGYWPVRVKPSDDWATKYSDPGAPSFYGTPTIFDYVFDPQLNEIPTWVKNAKEAGAEFIKVHNFVSNSAYAVIANESTKLGLPVVGHMPAATNLSDLVRVGQRSIEHMSGVLEACSPQHEEFQKARLNSKVDKDLIYIAGSAAKSYDEKLADEQCDLLKRGKVWLCPTLVTLQSFAGEGSRDIRDIDGGQYIRKRWLNDWEKNRKRYQDTIEASKAVFQASLEFTCCASKSGVGLLAGTDVGQTPFVFYGSSLASELELFVRAGLTPLQALQTATVNPAEFMDSLGHRTNAGSVRPGKLASLVVLNGDPLKSISNVRTVEAVVLRGQPYAKERLAGLLKLASQSE